MKFEGNERLGALEENFDSVLSHPFFQTDFTVKINNKKVLLEVSAFESYFLFFQK